MKAVGSEVEFHTDADQWARNLEFGDVVGEGQLVEALGVRPACADHVVAVADEAEVQLHGGVGAPHVGDDCVDLRLDRLDVRAHRACGIDQEEQRQPLGLFVGPHRLRDLL